MKKKENVPLNYKERVNSKISMIVSVAVLVVLCLIFHQLDYSLVRKPAIEAAKQEEIKRQQEEEAANAPVVSTASIIAVGDNLYHTSLLESGQYDSGIWNYDHLYANVLDEIQAADIAMIDQETVLTTDHDSISGYPSFATPTEVGDSLVAAGFDVIECATNHVDDYGYDYMAQTLNYWKTSHPEITLLGIHETQEDADSVKVLEVNGIKIAFLDYTYGTNNSGAGEGKEYMIDILEKDTVAAAIAKAKQVSDCIVFVAHWGNEDEPMPSEYEKQWATFLMQQGVDVVVGGHPHVLQPYGRMTDDQGNEMVIFYSLGNFVSAQQQLANLLGGMGCFTIEKTVTSDGTSTVRVLDPEVKPLVMHYDFGNNEYAAYMLEDYTNELAAQHSVRDNIGDIFTVENLNRKFDEIMSMNVTPSANTSMLQVTFDWEGNMVDPDGNYVEDNDSTTELQYYEELGVNISDYSGDSY